MTSVGVEVGAGRARLRLTGGPLSPRLLSVDATGAKVALVATTALLLGGDTVDLEIRVGAGAWLEVVETAGTVAYDAGGEPSGWNVRAVIEPGGLLLWHGEPFVVADGANTLRRSTFDLSEGAALCIRETIVLGRTGEIGGAVRVQTRVSRCGEPVLVEDLDFGDARTRALPGILGGAGGRPGQVKVIDTVTLLGLDAPPTPALRAGERFDLAAAGTVGRQLRTELAGSAVGGWFSTWREPARAAYLAHVRV